ncbi:PIN domain-containing protein [Streptacidiphilus sp. EB129]|uniref:PIN domain-containing protein n=1 Tax=Streptacidiphilus sp. EB129 TaxID=3156262 RepID=UPI003513B60A
MPADNGPADSLPTSHPLYERPHPRSTPQPRQSRNSPRTAQPPHREPVRAAQTARNVVWSERLLSEWERFIVRERQRSTESAVAVTRAIRRIFADCEIHESAYAHLVDEMPGDDPDDRHRSAAALAAGADVLITWNLAGFPAADSSSCGEGDEGSDVPFRASRPVPGLRTVCAGRPRPT